MKRHFTCIKQQFRHASPSGLTISMHTAVSGLTRTIYRREQQTKLFVISVSAVYVIRNPDSKVIIKGRESRAVPSTYYPVCLLTPPTFVWICDRLAKAYPSSTRGENREQRRLNLPGCEVFGQIWVTMCAKGENKTLIDLQDDITYISNSGQKVLATFYCEVWNSFKSHSSVTSYECTSFS